MYHDKTINKQLQAVKNNEDFKTFYKKDKHERRMYYRGLKKGVTGLTLEPNNLILGVDEGISNIGLSLILDNGNGSYTPLYNEVINFPEFSVEENQKRREFRGTRRVGRRYKLRRKELIDLLTSLELFDNNFYLYNQPFLYGVKGLNEKLSNGELTAYLLNRNKYRGYQYDLEEIEKDSESGENKKALSKNKKEMKELNLTFPCEMQTYKYNNEDLNHSFRGSENFYETSLYIKEVREVLKHQTSLENAEKIISLIFRRRKFDEGPGNSKSPTPFGSYYYKNVMKIDELTGEVSYEKQIVHTPLIEKMKNNCPIYPEEKAISKNSFINLWFELLNDLNNLIINQNEPRGLSTEEKMCIHDHIFNEGLNPTFNRIVDWLNDFEENNDSPISKEEVSGYRIDKKEQPIFTDFSVWCKYKQLIRSKKLSEAFDNLDIYDVVVDILSSYKNVPDRRRKLSSTLTWTSLDDVDCLTTLDVKGNGTYSKKAILNYFIKPMTEIERMNSEKVMRREGIGHHNLNRYSNWKNLKNIPSLIEDECHFMSPVAKRATNIVIDRINFLREYLDVEFGRIIIETPKDKNSEEERKRISAEQKENESRNKILAKEVEELGGNPDNPKHLLKMRLYHDQNGNDFYQLDNEKLKKINPSALFTTADYEVDHILPYSKTHDNSYENKILTYRGVNHAKGDFIAYDTMSLENRNLLKLLYKETLDKEKNEPKKDENGKKIKKTFFVSEEKWKKLLTPTTSLNDSNIQRKFTARNLCDTRIVAKTLAKHIDNYYNAKRLEDYVHILTINGQTTAYYRKKAFGENNKNRDCIYNHAVDSYLVALIGTYSNKSSEMNSFRYVKKDKKNNKIYFVEKRSPRWSNSLKEEEFISKIKNDEFLKQTIQLEKQEQKDKNYDELIYSDKIYVTCLHSKKKKGQISDQTIKCVKRMSELDKKGKEKDVYFLIAKTKNIYSNEGYKQLKKMFDSHKEDKLLCYHGHGTQIINFLKEWLYKNDLVDEKGNKISNPLDYYFKTYGPFRIGDKPVYNLRYVDVKYKSLSDINKIDITHKMKNCHNDKIVCLTYLYGNRTFVYTNEKGKKKFCSDLYKFNVNNQSESNEKEQYKNIKGQKEKVYYNGQVFIYDDKSFYISSCNSNGFIYLKNNIYKTSNQIVISINELLK